MSDDDRLLILVGVALVAFIGIALVTGVLAAMNPDVGEPRIEDTEWSEERVNETHVRVTYDDGPPLDVAEVVVSVDGYTREVSWTERITPGDSGLLRASPDRIVRVYWTDGSGPRELLASWRV